MPTDVTICEAAGLDRETASLACAEIPAATIPDTLLIAPWGEVESTNGDFIVDDEAAELVVRAFEAHGADLPIDYEHQTLGGAYTSPTGQAPAAGWITRMTSEPGVGLLAAVSWTEQAKAQLRARQYRYLSPVALVRKSDRRLVALHSAALTNKPAIVGMQAIVNRELAAAGDDVEHPMLALRAQLNIEDDASDETVLLAAQRAIAELTESDRRRRAAGRVAEAARQGRLTGAQRDWATRLVLTEERLFDEWLATAPVVVTPGRTAPPRGDDAAPRQAALAARARRDFRAEPLLAKLTTEDAYVADALRRT